jgi:hypothetical protein
MRQLKGFFNLTESNTLRNLVGCVLVIILFGLMNSPMHPVVGEYRYVPDLPIPDHPPCPLGSDCAIVHTCSPGPDPEFTTGWTATGSNRMMSSPHVVDLTGDGIQDIVVGTGISSLCMAQTAHYFGKLMPQERCSLPHNSHTSMVMKQWT